MKQKLIFLLTLLLCALQCFSQTLPKEVYNTQFTKVLEYDAYNGGSRAEHVVVYGRLKSVQLTENTTRVVFELYQIGGKKSKRLNYQIGSSKIYYCNSNYLDCKGFDDGYGGITYGFFYSNYGFNVVEGEKVCVVLLFDRVPPGITSFNLSAERLSYNNISITNPRIGSTLWDENNIKSYVESINDPICGIYEDNNIRVGCIKENDAYYLIYLDNINHDWGLKNCQWQEGDVKAVLRPTSIPGYYKANWYNDNKTVDGDFRISFYSTSFNGKGTNDTYTKYDFKKMYPLTTSNENIASGGNKGSGGGTSKSSGSVFPDDFSGGWSGSGFALNKGYLATNYHVVEGATVIKVFGVKGNFNVGYKAKVIITDKVNDLAVLKIDDNRFQGFGSIPYRVKTSMAEVGESCFVLGYPLTMTMGSEIKLTTGVVSARSGFQGDVSLYQISAPIQPGNSGGPCFDNSGNLVGIVNAKHKGAENVSYAIKASYLQNLVESSDVSGLLPQNNTVSDYALQGKVKSIKNFVYYIRCK